MIFREVVDQGLEKLDLFQVGVKARFRWRIPNVMIVQVDASLMLPLSVQPSWSSRRNRWSPPIISPCFYGIDTPTKKELIGSTHSIEEIRKYITADSLAYLSLEGLLAAAPGNGERYCNACFTENYPIPFTKAEELQLGLFDRP